MSRPTVVTVTEVSWNPGSYEVNVEQDGKMVVGRTRAGSDPGAAAAKAMQMAMEWGNPKYVILGSNKVLAFIPEQLRVKM
ncbi:TPA: anti-CRISPR protein [Pseudomonas aeruginosa]|uniref:anti-CRISPR protein n=1 Tax=Pseudomonas aeruginosa TaxID=287 RepID=UPI001495BE28|nr:anti-CRISPR protein [Pseudomonas aeruginosa]MCU8980323.1 anti-CRISPR protein [Pseudomonas aeruginosa]MCU8986533.1 anti-CRISPR protein [Pseudomonas aeruginosa]MCU8992869.1 anti-CRISPR protein [Pseudomonas aeruginosa]MCU8999059.1 anti-CRISPR protein [Pseudomonas aeruginosa]MCU9005380.1 anti-CRISPR protein [Pseudomonas aeruginosa]